MKEIKRDWREFAFRTRAVRAGHERTLEGEHAEPIFTTSSFVFKDAAQAAARFADEEPGNVYSRFTNPTVRMFEQRLAALEEGERCVATSSGMSSILATCMALLKAGDHIVAASSLFGATISLFNNVLTRFNLTTTFVSLTDLDAWRQAITPATRMLFLETPANPLTEVADIAALAELARTHNCLLVVDNVYCTPALQRPLTYGADIVVHSATKFLDGQGRCIGGAVVGNEAVGNALFGFLRTAGPSMSPFNAWVFAKGLETLDLRMHAHSRNAQQLAEWLITQRGINHVYYPGLTSHPQHELATRQQEAHGGLLSFEVDGDRKEAWAFIDATELVSKTANLGDVKTTITHPSTTTHHRCGPEARAKAGIEESLIRISVGLEDIDDLKQDLQRGLNAIR